MPTTTINLTGQALSKVDDTNVTLTLGGTPLTALLKATSLTLGWTGTLADSRIASAATWNAKESALTFSAGLTRTVNTITIDNTVVTLTGSQALSNKTGNISQWTNDSGYLTSLAGAVTSVTGSGNIASSGGATPNITFTGVLPTANGGTAVNIATQILTTGAGITNESGAAVSRIRLSANNNIGKILSWATTGLARWAIRVDGNETGANAGGDIALRRYDDAGTFIDNVWSAVRSTGAFTFEKPFYGTSSLTLGTASTTAGQLTLSNATNAFTQTIRGTNPVASITYDLPTTAPTSGQVLQSTAPAAGIATLSWATASSGITIGGTTITSGTDNRILFQDATASDFVTQIANFTMGSVAAGVLDVPTGYAIAGQKVFSGGFGNNLTGIRIGDSNTQTATSINSVFLGNQCGNNSTGARQVAIGYYMGNAYTSGTDLISIGNAGTGNTGANSVLLIGSDVGVWGNDVVSYDAVFGSPTGYRQFYLGSGKTKISPSNITIYTTGGSGSNNAGSSMTFATRSTGNATPPSIIFQTGTTLASGTTLQTPATRFTIAELRVTAAVPIKLMGYTVAALPAAPSVGDTAYCTDLLTPTFFTVAVGGGAVTGIVFYDGTIWKT